MKRALEAMAILLSMILFLSSCTHESKLAGEWISTRDNGSTDTLVLKEDGTIFEMSNNQLLSITGQANVVSKYEVDNSHSPHWIDFVIMNEGKEAMRIKGIYKMLSEKSMRICYHFDLYDSTRSLDRPSDFIGNETAILTRK